MKQIIKVLVVGLLLSACVPVFADSLPQVMVFFNETGYEIQEIFLSPADWDEWGDNQIADMDPVPAGGSVRLSLTHLANAGCILDIKAVDVDGDVYSRFGNDICENDEVTFTFDDFEDTFDESYDSGWDEGYQEGYKEGYLQGFRDAWSEAFKAGFEEAQQDKY